MESTKVKVYIERAKVNTVTSNGFIFYLSYCSIADIENFPILTNASSPISDGDWIEITKWSLSRLGGDDKSPIVFGILCEKFNTISIEECINIPGHFIFKYKCGLILTDKSRLQLVTFKQKPFIRASLKVRDMFSDSSNDKSYFYILAVGFYDVAKELSELRGCYKIEAELCLKRKRYGEGYELCINNYSIFE